MKPYEKHRTEAKGPLSFRVVTVSSSRFRTKNEGKKVTDESGDTAERIVGGSGHSVTARLLLPDDKGKIARQVREFLLSHDDVLLMTGGTGVAPSDVTIEAARPFFEKELEGFGELLRRVGYDEIGAAALLTRATAGVAKGKLVLCLPGSPGAVKTALESMVGEIPHIVHISRQH